MDKLSEGQIITLNDNREYVIVNIIHYNDKNYLNLLSIDEPKNILIVKAEDKYGMTILNELDNDEEFSKILDIIEQH